MTPHRRIARLPFTALCALSLMLIAPASFSGAEPDDLKGEIRISMNVAYASVTVNDAEYGGVTFEKNGKVCVVANLAESMFPVTINLKPSEEGYKSAEVSFEWKKLKKLRKRVKGGVHVYKLAKTVVKFAKGKDAPKPAKPTKPDDKPGKDPKKPDAPDDL